MTRITPPPFFGASRALDNLANTAANASIIPATDSAIDLGSSAPKYFANVYADTIVLSSVSSITAANVNLTATNAGGIFINSSSGQYSSSGFYMYNSASSMGNFAGVHMAANILDGSATQGNFAIDAVSYTGAYQKTYLNIALNDSVLQFPQQTYFLGNVGFNNTWPVGRQTVTGLKGANAALASLLTALSNYGLITDNSGT